jgi:hypothetical protein
LAERALTVPEEVPIVQKAGLGVPKVGSASSVSPISSSKAAVVIPAAPVITEKKKTSSISTDIPEVTATFDNYMRIVDILTNRYVDYDWDDPARKILDLPGVKTRLYVYDDETIFRYAHPETGKLLQYRENLPFKIVQNLSDSYDTKKNLRYTFEPTV